MDLLESVLRTCSADEYIANFKAEGIDSYTLKILSEEDLIILGISDEETRNNILSHMANLQIPAEKKIDINIDKQYLMLILNQISVQINKHYANLTYALKRSDTDLCSIKLTPSIICLENYLKSLELEITKIEENLVNKKKRKTSPYLLLSTITFTAALFFGFVKMVKM